MSTDVDFTTPYEYRVSLVRNVVTQNTQLDEKASRALAVTILQALDRIPERIR